MMKVEVIYCHSIETMSEAIEELNKKIKAYIKEGYKPEGYARCIADRGTYTAYITMVK